MGYGTLLYQGLAMTPEEFWSILQNVPEQQQPLRRLYYNDDGEPLFYATEDLPGNYIDLDQETFSRASSKVRVKNGQIISTVTHKILKKLVPSDSGTVCDCRDVCVVVGAEQSHIKWNVKKYEQS
jgi:hypothetical protein